MVKNLNISNLTLPRYAPFLIKGTVLAVWYDNMAGQYLVLCPKCHELIAYENLSSLQHELVLSIDKCCQGCRAKISFEKDPGLIGLFLGFWRRTGNFPQSTSWLDAIPPSILSFWEKEIKAAFQAERRN